MHKPAALVVACISTLFLAFLLTLFSTNSSQEQIVVARVIDGDTFIGEDGRTFRLSNVNAPEHSTSVSEEATHYLSLFTGAQVRIESLGTDKYGRTLVRLYAPEYVNRELVAQGLAVKFLVEKDEAGAFAAAESKAIAEQRGIWKHAPSFSCIRSHLNAQEEFVILKTLCGPLNVTGWTIRDESRKNYRFGEHMLTEVTVYTMEGTDNQTTVFWNSDSHIWNNDRDTLYLLDREGRIVHHESYGY